MAGENNQFGLTQFFSVLFHNFPRLLLTNLLFAVPFAVFTCIMYFINQATVQSMLILLIAIIPIFPFYAGVTQVTSHMVRGEEKVDVVANYIGGIKENFLKFLLHGILLYGATVFSYLSINMYLTLTRTNGGMFFALLIICILIAIFFLFSFFYLPAMTVTFDLPLKSIYKNSMLMTFGELKRNLLAVFGLFVLTLVCATALFCCGNATALLIVTAVVALLIVPSIASFIINSAIYKNMYSMIVNGTKKSDEINRKIENRKQGNFDDSNTKTTVVPGDFNDIDIDESDDGDEYIFYNGKMVKRSVLLRQKQNSKNKGE